MERLTEKHYLGTDHYMKCSGNCNVDMDCIDCPSFDRLVERLAAYEDTGLTPKEAKRMSNILMDVGIDYNCSWEYVKNWLLDDRLRELAEADRDGRVVLPSNKALTNADRIRAATNQQLAKLLYDNQKNFCRLMYKNLGFEDELEFSEDYSDILAWLNTSEKAEKALEEMKDGN